MELLRLKVKKKLCKLAFIAVKGKGVLQNFVETTMYYKIFVSNGFEDLKLKKSFFSFNLNCRELTYVLTTRSTATPVFFLFILFLKTF